MLSEAQINKLHAMIQGRRVLIEYPPEENGQTGFHASFADTNIHQAVKDLQQTRRELREVCMMTSCPEAPFEFVERICKKLEQLEIKYGWTEGGEDAKTVK